VPAERKMAGNGREKRPEQANVEKWRIVFEKTP
jgi:hypothetical protein